METDLSQLVPGSPAPQSNAMEVSPSYQSKGNIMSEHMPEIHNVFKPGNGGGGEGHWASVLPALMAERGGAGGFGAGGFGAGLIGGVLGGALFGGRRGGLFGGGGDDGGAETRIEDTVFQTGVLASLGDIKQSIPLTALQTQAAIASAETNLITSTLQQTIALEKDINSFALGTANNFSNVYTALAGVNQNISGQGCQTREAVQNDGDKTRALLTARFQLEDATRINELNARVIELQSEGRRSSDTADLRLQITNTNTAVAAQQQGQQQAQQQQILASVQSLFPVLQGLIQVAHATNSNVIAGNTGAVTTGAQAANPVNVAA